MKRAQSWYIDYTLSLALFIIAVLLFLYYMPEGNTDNTPADSGILSDTLMTEGIPEDWNTTNLTTPGLITDNKLDRNKLDMLRDLGYNESRAYLPISSDYLIYFENGLEGLGKINRSELSSLEADNIVHVRRMVPYQGRIIKMHVVVWE
ncbi:MAG: hypothetical protein ACQEP1_05270 [Nanobdellota archaeon]